MLAKSDPPSPPCLAAVFANRIERRFTTMPEGNTPFPNIKYPWQQIVLEAFLEVSPELLERRVNAAERAISARLCDPIAPDMEERTALWDALHSLKVLFPAQYSHSVSSGQANRRKRSA
jgi:hypothetical protein